MSNPRVWMRKSDGQLVVAYLMALGWYTDSGAYWMGYIRGPKTFIKEHFEDLGEL